MANRRTRRQGGTLVYPKHMLDPHDLLNFIELPGFSKIWDQLHQTQEEADSALVTLQIAIMCNPKGPPVIKGTRGLRKMRFGRSDLASGKSSGLRVCYVYLERYFKVLLAVVYPKSTKLNLTTEDKKRINTAIRRIETELEIRLT